ncbi:arogenate dehydratase/prephenate dehydratase 1, chloroplastic-like [Vicia villosa]|uniref:arogenate dehydratase/prephenate dehydratase 1, chloroplastic-like n=1 Tax=Vicia villosa TaxID=3911 RepID=UPI00273A927A|nr:arogenate dehydratase/prephenate dehydratase 1, chloroplastic-like [Vicia villosa]
MFDTLHPSNLPNYILPLKTLVAYQRATPPVEEQKPLLHSAYPNHSKRFHKDINMLPKPLMSIDDSSSASDGSKGLPGSYSEDAALKAYPNCETVPFELWFVDKAVPPIENSMDGSIHRNYDLLLRHRLHIVGGVQLRVSHCLLGLPGVTKEELLCVALAQCRAMLNDLGVDKIGDQETAVVAKFVIFLQTSVVFSLEEGPGALLKALSVFSTKNINLSKSRRLKQFSLRIVDDSNQGSSNVSVSAHQRATIPVKDQKHLLHSANQNHSKGFHKDINRLPKPLTSIDDSSSASDGSKLRVGYQGVPGAYGEDAAFRAYPKCETVPCEDYEAAFKAVELWLVDKAVLPIENSVDGSIHRNYDLLLRHRLHIVGEVQLLVNHCLLGLPGVSKEELNSVMSHPQALAQCKTLLDDLGVDKVGDQDTAVAAKRVAINCVRHIGAIASSRAAEIYGLDILAEGIQDDDENVTRFLVLAREPRIPGTDGPHKTSIVFSLQGGPGALFKALSVFSMRDINLSKIESRPLKQRPLRIVDDSNQGSSKYFDYLFYIDFEASMAEPRAQKALGQLQEIASFLRVFGCYRMDTHV